MKARFHFFFFNFLLNNLQSYIWQHVNQRPSSWNEEVIDGGNHEEICCSELNPVYVGFTITNSFKFKEFASACCALSLPDKHECFCSKNFGQKNTTHLYISPRRSDCAVQRGYKYHKRILWGHPSLCLKSFTYRHICQTVTTENQDNVAKINLQRNWRKR